MTSLRITLAKQSSPIFLFLRRKETKEPEKSKPAQPSPAHRPRYPFHPQIILYGFFEKLPAADEPAKSLRGLFTRPAPGIDFSRSHALAHCHFSALDIRHSAFGFEMGPHLASIFQGLMLWRTAIFQHSTFDTRHSAFEMGPHPASIFQGLMLWRTAIFQHSTFDTRHSAFEMGPHPASIFQGLFLCRAAN